MYPMVAAPLDADSSEARPTEPFSFLRPLRIVQSDRHWWHGPAVFTVAGALVMAIGTVPFIGAILSFFAQLPIAIWLLGWTAKCQSDRYDGIETLANPLDPTCLLVGARAWIVMFLWSVPAVIVGVVAAAIHWSIGGPSMLAEYLPPDLHVLARIADAVGVGGTVISVGLVLLGPVLHIAVVRSVVAGDWSGLRIGEVLATLRVVLVEGYLGGVVWLVVGLGLHVAGALAFCVGFFGGQALWFALFGCFWVDVLKLAVGRGAPPIRRAAEPEPDHYRS